MKKRFWVLPVLMFALPSQSPAQEETKPSRSALTMQEIVVTGTRTEEFVNRIPANVTVIDRARIEDSNAKNISDILRSEEGIVVRDLIGNGKTAIVDLRGFGEAAASNTLVLLDGRRVNAVDLSGTDWTQIPLEQVERIEIIRGTGSVLYGDNAVGGVINIITRTPSEKWAFSAGSTLGSYSRNMDQFSISGGQGKIAGRQSVGHDLRFAVKGAGRQAGVGEEKRRQLTGEGVEDAGSRQEEPRDACGRADGEEQEEHPGGTGVHPGLAEPPLRLGDETSDPDHRMGEPTRIAEQEVEEHRAENDAG